MGECDATVYAMIDVDDQYCFDITGFDHKKIYLLQLLQGTLHLSPAVMLQVSALQYVIQSDNLDSLNDSILGVELQ